MFRNCRQGRGMDAKHLAASVMSVLEHWLVVGEWPRDFESFTYLYRREQCVSWCNQKRTSFFNPLSTTLQPLGMTA